MNEQIEFFVNLIKCADNQTEEAKQSIKDNCTYVDKGYYICEDKLWILDTNNVLYEVVSCGEVPFLGDLSTDEIKKVCLDSFGIEI